MMPVLLVILMIVLGLALLAVELVVIPGFGLIGVLGGGAILAGGWIAYSQLSPGYGALALVGGLAGAVLMLWLLPKTRAARSMVLQTQHEGTALDPYYQTLLGAEGVALTVLRPAGTAEFAGRPVDVITDGQYVEAGTALRVIQVEGARVVVEPATLEPATLEPASSEPASPETGAPEQGPPR